MVDIALGDTVADREAEHHRAIIALANRRFIRRKVPRPELHARSDIGHLKVGIPILVGRVSRLEGDQHIAKLPLFRSVRRTCHGLSGFQIDLVIRAGLSLHVAILRIHHVVRAEPDAAEWPHESHPLVCVQVPDDTAGMAGISQESPIRADCPVLDLEKRADRQIG